MSSSSSSSSSSHSLTYLINNILHPFFHLFKLNNTTIFNIIIIILLPSKAVKKEEKKRRSILYDSTHKVTYFIPIIRQKESSNCLLNTLFDFDHMAVPFLLQKRRNAKTLTRRVDSVSNSSMDFDHSSLPSYKWRVRVGAFVFVLGVVLLLGISSNTWYASSGDDDSAPIYTVEIVNEFPHDHYAYTQGLLYWGNDTLYESTGLYGKSSVRKVDLQTGKVELQHKMEESIFAEGLTLIDDRLYQVTWLQNTGFIYERENFNNVAMFTHHMKDGWGLASDGKTLFGSDGSSTLYQMDPKTMNVTRQQVVRYGGHEVQYLNELEYINGEVWANIYVTDCIVRLSPRGTVVGWILLPNLSEELVKEGSTYFDVLNGIAWDSRKKRIFVTGKLWPKLFEIKLKRVKDPSQFNIRQLCMPHAEFHL